MALTPQQLAELQRLREMFKPLAEQARRQQQAQENLEKMNPQNKARGGKINMDVMRLAIGGQGPKNWLKGSVENVIAPLTQDTVDDEHLAGILKASRNPKVTEASRQEMANVHKDEMHRRAMNQWVERNLANYIKKQMATHDDPIRKLAEQGIVHMPPEQMGYGSSQAEGVRKKHGAPRLGQSPEAQAWEDATDVAMHKIPVSLIDKKPFIGKSNWEPWMEKADPNTEVFHPTDSMHAHYLGFDHLVDVLKQDLAEGRIRPEQLSKVSIEQAVRRVHEYDQAQKKKMAETALKATEGMPVHKDYGNGYKWIELTLPEMEEGWTRSPSGTYVSPEGEESIHHPGYGRLDDALKYEGDTMGHCVGGYTPDVARGNSRIFSLRDEKNEPHVTIEVKPPEMKGGQSAEEWLAAPQRIKQIKGKGNAKPKKDYIPYVQDFVKSGNWSEVGDLKNTDLIKHEGKYLTPDEHSDWLLGQLKPDQKARGGEVDAESYFFPN